MLSATISILRGKAIRMRELEQHTIFLREHVMLPEGIALSGDFFCEGWLVLRSGNALWLDKTIRDIGWNSNVLTKLHWKHGFSTYAHDAIRRAAQLALRKVEKRFNSAEIGRIVVIKYLWFYIAKVAIFSRSIQESPFIGISDELSTLPVSIMPQERPPAYVKTSCSPLSDDERKWNVCTATHIPRMLNR